MIIIKDILNSLLQEEKEFKHFSMSDKGEFFHYIDWNDKWFEKGGFKEGGKIRKIKGYRIIFKNQRKDYSLQAFIVKQKDDYRIYEISTGRPFLNGSLENIDKNFKIIDETPNYEQNIKKWINDRFKENKIGGFDRPVNELPITKEIKPEGIKFKDIIQNKDKNFKIEISDNPKKYKKIAKEKVVNCVGFDVKTTPSMKNEYFVIKFKDSFGGIYKVFEKKSGFEISSLPIRNIEELEDKIKEIYDKQDKIINVQKIKDYLKDMNLEYPLNK